MKLLASLTIGYLMGTISPSAMLSKIKNVNMKEEGTKNLGASNTTLLLGKGYGALVMVLDIFKSIFAGKIARWLFPNLALAGMVACLGAVIGHIFPFYLHFSGGKGLACFGGMVLFFNPWVFLFYITVGVGLMLLVNRSAFLPLFASVTFPIIVLLQGSGLGAFAIAVATGLIILYAHRENFGRVDRGEEAPIRQIFARLLKKK